MLSWILILIGIVLFLFLVMGLTVPVEPEPEPEPEPVIPTPEPIPDIPIPDIPVYPEPEPDINVCIYFKEWIKNHQAQIFSMTELASVVNVALSSGCNGIGDVAYFNKHLKKVQDMPPRYKII